MFQRVGEHIARCIESPKAAIRRHDNFSSHSGKVAPQTLLLVHAVVALAPGRERDVGRQVEIYIDSMGG